MLKYFTVEYDGYTYKKEEKKQEERSLGSHHLINTLSLTESKKEELQKIINRMSTKSKWKDLSDKQERLYMKMERILLKLKTYTPFSTPFLSKVSKREAPEYYNLIENPMDLGKMGKKLFLQEYSDVNEFSQDLNLIWENCFRFNNTHGNVYAMYAQKMKEKSLVLLQDLFSEREIEIEEAPEEVQHFYQSEKYRKEMVATRAAIIQNPAEFTSKRTSHGMHEYWKKEMQAIKSIRGEEPDSSALYLPEYIHFYNSFPVIEEAPLESSLSEYSLDDICQLSHSIQRKNSNKTHRVAEKSSFDPKIEYMNNTYMAENKTVENIAVGRAEVLLILKKVVTAQLLSVGFTSTETSALNILVSYIMHKLESTMRQVADCARKASCKENSNQQAILINLMAHALQINSAEAESPAFFSEDDEETDEDSIIDMIYSNTEDVDIEIDDDIV